MRISRGSALKLTAWILAAFVVAVAIAAVIASPIMIAFGVAAV